MDTARDVHTIALVEAEELWNMVSVDSEGYICRGCKQQVFPASYNKQINRKRPYFTLGPANKHLSNCDVDGEEVILKRAKKEAVGTPEGYPLPFPNRLVLTEERIIEGGNHEASGVASRARTPGSREGTETAPRKYHGHTVKTIRSICRTFIELPNDRPTMPLSIPGVEGNTYAKVFKYVRGNSGLLDGTRLFYAPIRWTAPPTITDEYCELTLSAGEWDEANGRFVSLYRVRLNWANWSKSRRDMLIREYESTRLEAREQASKNKNIKGWLFFVGALDAANSSVFKVDNHGLICSLSGAIDWPK